MSNIDERTGKPKIILDLCGGTGSWSRFYKKLVTMFGTLLCRTTTCLNTNRRKMSTEYLPPPLYGVFGFELQSRGKGKEARGGPENRYSLPAYHTAEQTQVVGNGKPGRIFERVHGETGHNISAVAVRRPLDETYRPMGNL